jgi:hypothetical protein
VASSDQSIDTRTTSACEYLDVANASAIFGVPVTEKELGPIDSNGFRSHPCQIASVDPAAEVIVSFTVYGPGQLNGPAMPNISESDFLHGLTANAWKTQSFMGAIEYYLDDPLVSLIAQKGDHLVDFENLDAETATTPAILAAILSKIDS